MLQDLVMELATASRYSAKERAYQNLEKVGVDRFTAYVMAKEFEEKKTGREDHTVEKVMKIAYGLGWRFLDYDKKENQIELQHSAFGLNGDMCRAMFVVDKNGLKEMRYWIREHYGDFVGSRLPFMYMKKDELIERFNQCVEYADAAEKMVFQLMDALEKEMF